MGFNKNFKILNIYIKKYFILIIYNLNIHTYKPQTTAYYINYES